MGPRFSKACALLEVCSGGGRGAAERATREAERSESHANGKEGTRVGEREPRGPGDAVRGRKRETAGNRANNDAGERERERGAMIKELASE